MKPLLLSEQRYFRVNGLQLNRASDCLAFDWWSSQFNEESIMEERGLLFRYSMNKEVHYPYERLLEFCTAQKFNLNKVILSLN